MKTIGIYISRLTIPAFGLICVLGAGNIPTFILGIVATGLSVAIFIEDKKKYEELLEIKSKYNHFTGQEFTIYVGGRTLNARLMQLSKEELIRIILDIKSSYGTLLKEYKKVATPEHLKKGGSVDYDTEL